MKKELVSNEDINGIIKIIKSLEDLGVLIDRVTGTVKHEIQKQEGRFPTALLALLATSIVQPVASKSSKVVIGISKRGIRRARRGYMNNVSISAFGSLVCVPVGIISSAVGMKICAITAGIKK